MGQKSTKSLYTTFRNVARPCFDLLYTLKQGRPKTYMYDNFL